MQEASISTGQPKNSRVDSAASLLKNCTSLTCLRQIQALIYRTHLHQNNSLAANLVALCGALSAIPYAELVFSSIAQPNRFLFNQIIKLYSKNSLCPQAIYLYRCMTLKSIKPDNFTFPFLLNSCASLSALNQGREIHCRIAKTGFNSSLPVQNALVDMYGKCDSLGQACQLFDEMSERDVVSCNALLGSYARLGENMVDARTLFNQMSVRTVISWNAMIVGYVNHGDLDAAHKVFDEMPERNVVSWTTMLMGYIKFGFLDSAHFLFEEMPERNLISWTAMITGYAQNGQPNEALKIFHRMQNAKVKPDAVTMTGVISAAAQLGGPELANWVGSFIYKNGIELNAHVLTALLDMHAKCGNVDKAWQLFEEIPERDVFSYSALITGLASHGYGTEALQVFNRMQVEDIKPDDITFIGVLNACSHAGLVDEGLRFWESMINDYKINPCEDLYACLVDMLGRAGQVNEAYDILKSMPRPYAGALGALLAACYRISNIEIAEIVAEKLFELEPENTGNYVLLANMYAASNRWDDAARIRVVMKERGVKKLAGCSWIETNRGLHGVKIKAQLPADADNSSNTGA